MILRDHGKQVIQTVVSKPSNVQLVEKYIYNHTKGDTDAYMNLLYESMLYLSPTGAKTSTTTLKSLIVELFNERVEWNHAVYADYRHKIEEEDNFALNPFEIEEGVLECKCGSKRTISYQRQTRSADEGSTTFAQCVECGTKWRHNN